MLHQVENPLELKGVAFIEYAGQAVSLQNLLARLGFQQSSRFQDKNLFLYTQNKIKFILNSEANTFAHMFFQQHGGSICSTGFVFADAMKAYQLAVQKGARPYQGGHLDYYHLPAVYGIGDSLIYFLDPKTEPLFWQRFNMPSEFSTQFKSPDLLAIDHFTNNVPVGEMQKWCDFYKNIFGFYEARFFNIRGHKTGLISKVMRSPCGTFSIPINEPTESKSQIQEYLDEYKGSGIQHLALLTDNILSSVERLKNNGVQFLTSPPPAYYKMLPERVPNIGENLSEVEKWAVLIDGDQDGYLLQIFTKNMLGPIFFEVIQRKNHHGFGDGNFQALFDAIERDQKERGYLT